MMHGALAAALREVLRDEAGSELVEYALVASVLGVAMIAAVVVMINSIGAELDATSNGWQSMATTPP